MQVNILGKLFDYNSDFDPIDIHGNRKKNWKVSAGDYFKYPVKVGTVYCFVKRFDKKPPNISGYNFLVKIKGIKHPGLPVVYDIVETKEEKRDIIYIFTQYLTGNILYDLQKEGFSFLPIKMAGDLFFALKSIHDNGFWFPDFDPKNLFLSAKGDFYIIDLDSTYPLSVLPTYSIPGSKDYWAPVYDFFRENVGFSVAETKELKGDVLNNLNLIYFMALYSFYLFGDGEDLTTISIKKLNEDFQKKNKLFSTTIRYCFFKKANATFLYQRPLTFDVFSSLINNCLFTIGEEQYISTYSKNAKKVKPKVRFNIVGNNSRMRKGDKYILEWQTLNVTSVLLDEVSESLNGYKHYVAKNSIDHRLKAIHNTNQTTISKVSITVEITPIITITAQPNEIESGGYVNLRWTVKNGKKIKLLQNNQTIIENCTAEGNRTIHLNITDNTLNTQMFNFTLQTENNLEEIVESVPVQVSVKKKSKGCGILFWIIVIIIIIWIIYRMLK